MISRLFVLSKEQEEIILKAAGEKFFEQTELTGISSQEIMDREWMGMDALDIKKPFASLPLSSVECLMENSILHILEVFYPGHNFEVRVLCSSSHVKNAYIIRSYMEALRGNKAWF